MEARGEVDGEARSEVDGEALSEVDGEAGHKNNIDPLPKGYNPKQVEDGVKILFKILQKSSKKSLFEGEGEYIKILISAIRVPKNRKKHYRFPLPNGFLKETAEVCLFVKNLSKTDREYENTVRHFKNILAVAGVTGVSEVISINQLMQEYKTYEMKRRLASRFDMFLADNAVNNWLHSALGKSFHRCRKQPTPVRLYRKDLKAEIDKALVKTSVTISGNGAQVLAKIGHTKQSVEKICQNIEAFVKKLRYTFPGKWKNIRSLLIRTDESIPVPIYYSFAHPNTVKVPKQPQETHKKMIPIEVDEINTLPDGYKVMVLPSGDVKVKGKKLDGTIGWLTDLELKELGHLDPIIDDDEEEEVQNDGDDELMLDSEEFKRVTHFKPEKKDHHSDSEEEEAGVEAAEDAYLKELNADMVNKVDNQKLEKLGSNKRKLEKSDFCRTVKKSKSATKAKINISNWKVEVISSSGESQSHNGKSVKNINKSWKVDEVVEATEAKNSPANKASVTTKKEVTKKKISMPINNKNKGSVSNFGIKGKVSGNKLGKKKKLKHEL